VDVKNKATRIELFSLKTRQMRAFHMSWFAFFLCFFAWFGIAPLMAVVREELSLTKAQIGNTIIASVAITILARWVIGWLCDRIGPRLSYTALLILGGIPVMSIGLADSYTTFMLFRLGIGVIGAAFVITQYHTSVMFAPNCVGTANATSAGWGNLGGGVTQMIMPLVFGAFVYMGFSDAGSWRGAMIVAGAVCMLTGVAYFFFTTDMPDGNFKELRERGELRSGQKVKGTFLMAAKDKRVWALFVIYAACFGIELTINNIAALYYMDYFDLGIKTAGLVAGLFGLMNIFARTLGGFISDKFVVNGGLRGRVKWLFIALLVEGFALMFFSQMRVLALAIPVMVVFSLFVQMSEGATFSIVPFINKKALGSVAGIVGAGGNMGAVAAGFLLRAEGVTYPQALLILGVLVALTSGVTALVTFSKEDEEAAAAEHAKAVAERRATHAEHPTFIDRLPGLAHIIQPMDVLRIYLGVALVIKGVYFITNRVDLEKTMPQGLGDGQTLLAWGIVFAHIVGGACLSLGFVSRVAAAANAVVLAGAVWVHVSGMDFSSMLGANLSFQFTFFVFVTLILFIWRGSGQFSLDRVLNMDQPLDPDPEAQSA
jgi:NNP family nitrate/nitrite transporter-like MFS transporter